MTFLRVSMALAAALILGCAVAVESERNLAGRGQGKKKTKFQVQKTKSEDFVTELKYLKDLLTSFKSPKLRAALEAEARKNRVAAQVLSLKNEKTARKRYIVLADKIDKFRNDEILSLRKKYLKLMAKLDEEEERLKKGLEEVETAFSLLEKRKVQPAVGSTLLQVEDAPKAQNVTSEPPKSLSTTSRKSESASVSTSIVGPAPAPAQTLAEVPMATVAPTPKPALAPALANQTASANQTEPVDKITQVRDQKTNQTTEILATTRAPLAAPIIKQETASINSELPDNKSTVTEVKAFDSEGVSTFQHGGIIESASENGPKESLVELFSPARSAAAIKKKQLSKRHASKPKVIVITDESKRLKHSGRAIDHTKKSLNREHAKDSKELKHQVALGKKDDKSKKLINRLTKINEKFKKINDKRQNLNLHQSGQKATAGIVLTEKGQKQIIQNVLNKHQNIKGDNGSHNDLKKADLASKNLGKRIGNIKATKYPKVNIKTDDRLQKRLEGSGKGLSAELANSSSKIAKAESRIGNQKLDVKVAPVQFKNANKIANKLGRQADKKNLQNLSKEAEHIKKGTNFTVKVKDAPVHNHKADKKANRHHARGDERKRRGSPPSVGTTNA